MLFRAVAVRLAALGRVDAGQPDPVLLVGGVEDGEGIAVGDADDFAEEICGRGCIAEREEQCGQAQT